MTPRYRVEINEIHTWLNVGICAWEKHADKKQLIIANITLYAHAFPLELTLHECLDYSLVVDYITNQLPLEKHCELLEEIALNISRYCFSVYKITQCDISLTKKHVFEGIATPTIHLTFSKEL